MIKYQVINREDMDKRLIGVGYYINGRVEQTTSHGYSYLDARKLISGGEEIGLETLPVDICQMHFEMTGTRNKDLERIIDMLKTKENKLK